MHYPQSWTATGLAGVLRSGPASSHVLWNISGYVKQTGSSGHFVVIAGIRGDGTEGGTTGRRGALYGIGVGIVLAMVYWTANNLFGAIGEAGILSPALAAWAPNILFGAGAAYLLYLPYRHFFGGEKTGERGAVTESVGNFV